MEEQKESGFIAKIKGIYSKNIYKLAIGPTILVIASLIILVNFYMANGDIMEKDVSLKGGITATVNTEQAMNIIGLQKKLADKFGDASVRKITEFGSDRQIGIITEVATEDEASLKELLSQEMGMKLTEQNYSLEVMGSSLGSAFYKQMITAMIAAFLLMAIVIFFVFRTFVPSMAMVLAALFDILVTIAIVDLLHIRVSTTGISAFLLLIGYSIDTDALLTTRVIKRTGGTAMDRAFKSIGTGLTMTLTALVAVLSGLVVSQSPVIKEMFIIIAIGLCVDVVMTYGMNAPMLLWYVKRKGMQ